MDEARPRNVGESTLALWQPAGVMLLEMAAEQERVQRNLLNEKSLFSSFFLILTNTLLKAKRNQVVHQNVSKCNLVQTPCQYMGAFHGQLGPFQRIFTL